MEQLRTPLLFASCTAVIAMLIFFSASSKPHRDGGIVNANSPLNPTVNPALEPTKLFDGQSVNQKTQIVDKQALSREWMKISESGYALTADEIALVRTSGAGRSLLMRAKNADPLASITLLRYVGFCLSLPSREKAAVQDSGDGREALNDQDCFAFFGDGITDRQGLNSLSLKLLRTVAQSGFDPGATEYWRSIVALDADGRSALANEPVNMSDHTAIALSLLTNLANKGDTGAVLALVEAYQYGRVTEPNPMLAAHYAAVLVRQPEYAAIPWLKKLADTGKR
jgi:hypothetical protein